MRATSIGSDILLRVTACRLDSGKLDPAGSVAALAMIDSPLASAARHDAVALACLLEGLLGHPDRPLTELTRVLVSRSLLDLCCFGAAMGYILPKNAASIEPRAGQVSRQLRRTTAVVLQ